MYFVVSLCLGKQLDHWAYLAILGYVGPTWAMSAPIGLMLSHFGVWSGKSWDHILAIWDIFILWFVLALVGQELGPLGLAILGYARTFLATTVSAYLEPCWATLEQTPGKHGRRFFAQQQPAQQGHPPGMAEQQGTQLELAWGSSQCSKRGQTRGQASQHSSI